MNSPLAALSTLLVYGAMACYTIAMVSFAADLSSFGRGADPNRKRRAVGIAMSITWLGFGCHLLAVVLRGVASGRVPWANMYEFSLVFTMLMVGIFLAVNQRKDIRYLGTPVVLMTFATLSVALLVLYTPADGVQPALQSYWMVIHVSVATLSTSLFGIATAASVLHVMRLRDERSRELAPALVPHAQSTPGGPTDRDEFASSYDYGHDEQTPTGSRDSFWSRLMDATPPSAAIETFAYRFNAVGFVAWTFVLITGSIWAEHAWGRAWGWDPKETWSFVVWVLYAAYLHVRLTTGWAPQKYSYISIAGFLTLLANFYIVNIFINSMHSSYSGI